MCHSELGLLLALVCSLQLTARAIMIENKQMSIDEAIMKASTSSKLFELMQDEYTVLVEMDMLYPLETYTAMRQEMARGDDDKRKKRKAVSGNLYRWTKQEIPYEISYEFSSYERQLIMSAIAEYHKYTCLKFRPATSADGNKIRYQNGAGCSSYVGMIGGTQQVSLAPGCRYKGIIIHETGHAIGFHHEQTRPDRDSFVTINERNIQPGVAYNFMRYTTQQQDTYRVPYDYTSVMHYAQYAFSYNGQPTITARDPRYQSQMGNRDGLSFLDIQMANAMYNCAAVKGCRPTQCPVGGFLGPDCTCWCDSGDRMNPVKVCSQTAATTPAITVATGRVVTTATTTTAPTAVSCEDLSKYCRDWKESGFCTGTYERYMQTNCKHTCNHCTAAVTTTTAMPTPPITNCTDSNVYCDSWAKNGECTRNPSYMLKSCPRACQRCRGEPIECRDRSDYCTSWARSGYCNNTVYRSYLEMNCRRSCGLCAANDEEPTTPAPSTMQSACSDTRNMEYCEREKQKNQCTSNPRVQSLCRKTCGMC